MPGLVDSHVHINEPGRTEWEGFETATRAAAAGGVTTIIDMPLNSIPATTSGDSLKRKIEAAVGKCFVDVGFWGGVVPGNTSELREMFSGGVVGFKCFLVDSGVPEFSSVAEHDLRQAMPLLAELGAVLIVHAEVPGPIEHACVAASHSGLDSRKYETFLRSRPGVAEDEAVQLMVRLCCEYGTRVHIVHHSSAGSLGIIRDAKDEGLPLTAETCPHYLSFASEDIPDGATEFKCCPPIRERKNREELWQALRNGTIDMVVSDHSPCPPSMKEPQSGDFMKAWGGISSLQLRLPIMWTRARERNIGLSTLAQWLCSAPSALVGLERKKGRIAAGYDADMVIWNPEESFEVSADRLYHRHKVTPYMGSNLRGVVKQTYLRGESVFNGGEFSGPKGELILS
jgi:allantoinase